MESLELGGGVGGVPQSAVIVSRFILGDSWTIATSEVLRKIWEIWFVPLVREAHRKLGDIFHGRQSVFVGSNETWEIVLAWSEGQVVMTSVRITAKVIELLVNLNREGSGRLHNLLGLAVGLNVEEVLV